MRAVALVLLTVVFAGDSVTGQNPSTSDVLRRAAAYVEDYRRKLETIVAEEHYVQRSFDPANAAAVLEERTLRSDFMLLPGTPGENPWFAFRDVFEVDGKAVSGERGRLEGWLADSRSSLMLRARALAVEQARYNIGPVMRTINVPTLALEILTSRNQERFRFRRSGPANFEGIEVIVLSFEERRRPTMIRTPEGRDLPAKGTLWIEPATGRVLRTELRTGERARDRIEAAIGVTYQLVERLEMHLPVTMDEEYTGARTGIICRASYRNFRRFETDARLIRKSEPGLATDRFRISP